MLRSCINDQFLANGTATQCDQILASSCHQFVCNVVHCGSQGWCRDQHFLACKFLYVCSDTFGVSVSHKIHMEKRVEDTVNASFLRQRQPCYKLVYCILLTVENMTRSASRTLLVTRLSGLFGYVHKLYPKRSDCLTAICRPKLVTKTGLTVC